MPDRLLSLKDACLYLGGVSRATLYRERADGRITFVKVRGSTCIRESEIERYIKAKTLKGRAA
jgi:excisionase family DNA binding protein